MRTTFERAAASIGLKGIGLERLLLAATPLGFVIGAAACGVAGPSDGASAAPGAPAVEADDPPAPGEPSDAQSPAHAPETSLQQTAREAAGWRKQVIYLVMPDRFRNGDTSNDDAGAPGCHDPNDPQRFHGGDLTGLEKNLGYVEELGATAVWVTPLYRQIQRLANMHCGYHGYWGDFVAPYDDGIEPKLGTAADLDHLVSALHAKQMRFVLDMVVNHTGDTAPLPKQRPGWFHDPHTCGGLGNATITCPLDGHPDFAQEKPEVAAYLSDVAARWTKKHDIDAIRMDTAKHVPASYFAQSFFPAVRGVRTDLFAVAEVFDDGSLASAVPYVDAGFDAAFHFPLRRALVLGIAKGGSVDLVAGAVADGIAKLGMERALDAVLLLDNHDVPRFVNEPGPAVSEDEIAKRYRLALSLLFTLPGIPQLYYGDELGMYGGGDPDNRRDLPAWATNAAERRAPHAGQAVGVASKTFDRVKRLAALRKTTAAFIDGGYRELWRQNAAGNPNVYAFARGEGQGARVVIVSNGSRASGVMRIPVPAAVFPSGAELVEELADGDGAPATLAMQGGQVVVDLPAHAVAIYRRK